MLDKLNKILINYDSIVIKMSDPNIVQDIPQYTKLAKELISINTFHTIVDDNGWTPLHHAIYCGNYVIFKLLLQKKVAPNIKDNNGMLPIHLAVLKGNIYMFGMSLK